MQSGSDQQKPPAMPQPPHRYEGVDKVTGTIKYAAEFTGPFPRGKMAYAYMVQSTIPSGTIASIDSKAAEHAPGVIAVITPFNAPKLQTGPPKPPTKRSLTILQDTNVDYNGQPIAVVVAESLVEATRAARMLNIRYNTTPAKLDFMGRLGEAAPPRTRSRDPNRQQRGDAAQALGNAQVKLEQTYITPIQNHNPMEPHATIAWWEGEKLSVYDATQAISGDKMTLARILNLAQDDVHVMDPVVGGGFGCKGSTWSHVLLAAMSAKLVGRPVKLVLGREQMWGPVGARPTTVNMIKIAANTDGKITAIKHDAIIHSSVMEDFIEESIGPSRVLYQSGSNDTSLKCVQMNYGVPTFMRAPGEAPGTAVLEIAMDEMAEKLKMDPIQFRMVNYAEKDLSSDRPWSSKHLDACYKQAAERFGWSKRNATPGQMSEGNELIGYGMATATYPANRSDANCLAKFLPDGKAFVGSGSQDLGTGMYTIMQQVAAQTLGMDLKKIEVKLGDSTLPKAPVSGGSQSTASVGPAVQAACQQLMLKTGDVAIGDPQSPLHGVLPEKVTVKAGRVFLKDDPSKGEDVTALIARNGNRPIETDGSAQQSEDHTSMTANSWGAVFAEVAVDKTTHMVKVRRLVATYDIGTLMNEKTGLNQLMGGLVWGVGFALEEETHQDPNTGRAVNENLAEYHVPVNRDINVVDVTVLNIPDMKFNPLGARGIGEIGITGGMAAIANAIYNATGKRIRHYPITPDKLMSA